MPLDMFSGGFARFSSIETSTSALEETLAELNIFVFQPVVEFLGSIAPS